MSEPKTILFAFRGDPLCFIHVLLNSMDMHRRGQKGKIVLEGESVTLVAKMAEPGHFLNSLYTEALGLSLFHGACKACATKLEAVDAIEKQGIALIGEMSGHPSMGEFVSQGYRVITF